MIRTAFFAAIALLSVASTACTASTEPVVETVDQPLRPALGNHGRVNETLEGLGKDKTYTCTDLGHGVWECTNGDTTFFCPLVGDCV